MFLFLCFFLPKSLADELKNVSLPPLEVLLHHDESRLPKPYWPFNLGRWGTTQNELTNNQNQKTYLCDFPAIAFYNALKTSTPPPNFKDCPELIEYLDKVPIEDISLVYASENLISPSSMMGHVFLKLTGTRQNGENVRHAVSFYTDTDGLNIPKLFLETMLSGKKGVFALSPYTKFIHQYVNIEQRNLWEYKIDLNNTQKKLIQLHLWELKNADLPYFFDRYNCATLISLVLKIGRPEIRVSNLSKVSPIDVVKAIEAANVVKNRSVILSSEWQTRMLSETVSPNILTQLKGSQELTLPLEFESEQERFLVAELGLAYTQYRHYKQLISAESADNLSEHYLSLKKDLNHLEIDLSSYKSPNKLPNDSQWYIGHVYKKEKSFVRLGYLPAGLRVEDDSRQYFGNNELRLMEGSILYNPSNNKVLLDEFSFYSMSTLKPYNTLTGGLSGKFEVVLEDHYDSNLDTQKSFDLEGGVGLTKKFFQDFSAYSLASMGAGFGRGSGYFHSSLETGLIINFIFDSKLITTFTRSWGQVNSNGYYDLGQLKFSKFINNNWSSSLEWRHLTKKNKSLNEYSFDIKYLY